MKQARTDAHTSKVLAVDLDGTLLRSDMLYECLWSAMAKDAKATFSSLTALSDGRAQFKRRLAELSDVDVATLPYDGEVLDRIRTWRDAGGRAVLVTASDQGLADKVAAHLGVFDEVHGSDGVRNLKAEEKAAFLTDRFPQGFTYMGDSAADLAVWESADHAISVGASQRTRAALDAGSVPAEHLERETKFSALRRAMRPQQWLKNLLVLVPLVADPSYGVPALLPVLAAFLSLSLAASAGYLINDLLDLQDDRSHPRKRMRPFASGALSTATGTMAVPALLAGALVLALLVSPALLAVVTLYFVATLSYSVRLKRHTLIDICVLAFLFTLRIVAGGVAMGSPLSVWILAFSMFIFFALAAVKRLAELTDTETAGRETSRRGYQPEDRRVVSQMAITSGYLAVLVLALYVDEPETQAKFGAPWLLWGMCPLLLFWISRLVLVADRGEMHDDPMIFAITNSTSRLVILFCGILALGAVIL
ncbi:UbiA family prenyltransferase [Rhodobacterales bacterium HKCCE4037]|nr:UbiA family prenyltransferase [Rhodobacterales bacterium HKCCE4037]